MKILCTGDIHIGRRPTRLPEHADARACSCAACWTAIVELAVREAVELVALSGDVVDRANRYFEAYGPLERGLQRLAEAGIPAVAVAGNHDYDVLPRLADDLGAERFRLLGRGGRWERWTLERDGRPVLHVDGWSFPAEHVADDPLAGYDLPADPEVPVLGLLHADLEQPRSRYAPVTLDGLRRRPPVLWLLGHVHAPAVHRSDAGAAPVIYPGSPQAMDPGEPGVHGPWLVELGAGAPRARQVPLSRVRYDTVTVDVEGVEAPEELEARAADAVRRHLTEVTDGECGPLRHLCCRLRVVGRTPLHRRVEDVLEAGRDDLEITRGDVAAVVEAVEAGTRPALELEALARGGDPPAVLARLLLALEDDDGDPTRAAARRALPGLPVEVDALVRDARRRTADLRRAKPYRSLDDAADHRREGGDDAVAADDDPRTLLRRQGMLLLDALLAQKEDGR